MNKGAKRHRTHTLPRCTACGPIGNVIRNGYKNGRQRYRCTRCLSQLRDADPPAQEEKQPGIVAGMIEIGRGSVWWAGLV